MKRESIIHKMLLSLGRILFILGIMAIIHTGHVFAQTDSAAAVEATEEEEEEEESGLIAPSLTFLCIQKGDMSLDLKGLLQARVNGSNKKLPHLKISFVQVAAEEEKPLGFAITDVAGRYMFNCKPELVTPDKEGNVTIKATFAGNKAMDPVEEEFSFKRARLEVTPVKEDDIMSVAVKLVDLSTGEAVPVPEATVGVFVKRYFNPLKVGEITTDENGEGTAEIPAGLPGDKDGNLTFVVKVDEHESFGNLEVSMVQKWGTPTTAESIKKVRALWSPHPPMWMLVTFIILISTVWGHYLVIIYELIRLRKEEPHTS